MSGSEGLQPLLHDAVVVLAAPSQAWGDRGGDISGGGIAGFYDGDRRILSELTVRVGGVAAEPIATATPGAPQAEFVGLLRGLDDGSADPRLRIIRRRTVSAGSLTERIALESTLEDEVETTIVVAIASDLATMHVVKAGLPSEHPAPVIVPRPEGLAWGDSGVSADLAAPGADVAVPGRGRGEASWTVSVPPKSSVSVELTVTATAEDPVVS